MKHYLSSVLKTHLTQNDRRGFKREYLRQYAIFCFSYNSQESISSHLAWSLTAALYSALWCWLHKYMHLSKISNYTSEMDIIYFYELDYKAHWVIYICCSKLNFDSLELLQNIFSFTSSNPSHSNELVHILYLSISFLFLSTFYLIPQVTSPPKFLIYLNFDNFLYEY